MATSAETQIRLDAYIAAESEILAAQQMSSNGKYHRMAELKDVQAWIDKLQLKLNRQKNADSGRGLGSLANMNKARM